MHLIYGDQKKQICTKGSKTMKLKKMIAAIVVGVMAWMTVGTAMALVK